MENNATYSQSIKNYLITNIVPRLASIILLPVFLRIVEVELWGEISFLVALQIVFVTLFSLGLESSGFRFFNNFSTEQKVTFINKINKKFFLTNLIFLLFIEFVFGVPFANYFGIDYGLPMRFTILTAVILSFTRIYLNFFRSQNRSEIIKISSYLESFLIPLSQILLMGLIIISYGFEDRMIVSAFFLGQLLGTFVKFSYLRRNLLKTFNQQNNDDLDPKSNDVSKFAWYGYMYSWFSLMLVWQDKFLLQKIYSFEKLAHYSTIYRLVDMHGVVIGTFVSTLGPFLWSLNKKNYEETEQLFSKVISISALTGALGVSLSVIIGPIILPEGYQFTISLVPSLAIGMVMGSYASLYGLLLEKNLKMNIRVFSIFMGAMLNLILILNWVTKYDLLGLAIATSLSYGLVFVINFLYAESRYKKLILNKYLATSGIVMLGFHFFYVDIWYMNLISIVICFTLGTFILKIINSIRETPGLELNIGKK